MWLRGDCFIYATWEGIEQKVIEEAVVEEIIKPTLPSEWFSKRTKIFVNPTGNFVSADQLVIVD